MKASRAIVDRVVSSGETAYGINTGFGKLASVRISTEQVRQLQVNLVRSHACGVGAPLSEAETRAMMLLRANALAKGLSGIRPETVEALCAMLNAKSSPSHSLTRFRRRIRRPRPSRASRARRHRRRPRPHRRKQRRNRLRCRRHAPSQHQASRTRSQRRSFPPQRHARHAGVTQPLSSRRRHRHRHRRRRRRSFA